jgi:glycine betaine catabolism B
MMAEENEGYHEVANKKELKEGDLLKVDFLGRSVVLTMGADEVYAIDAVCTHEGGPLEEGTLEGYEVECPWHGSRFDVRTGEVRNPPADTPVTAYEVKLDNDKIMIKVKPKSEKRRQASVKKEPPLYELNLFEKEKIEGTDIMSFKFSKQNKKKLTGDDDDDKMSINYIAGQYAYFDIGEVYDDPKGPIRHFTIASSPTENFIMISTRIRDTPYKKRLALLEDETIVKVRGPEGEFVLHEDYSKPAVFLSGGIGVTPFRSMIKNATDRQLPLKIVMFVSNRNEQNILYKSEFDEWANINNNLKIVYTITEEDGEKESSSPSISSTWKGERGRITHEMITRHVNNDEVNSSVFYVCGPPAMLNAMKSILEKELHVTDERIKVEEFTGY